MNGARYAAGFVSGILLESRVVVTSRFGFRPNSPFFERQDRVLRSLPHAARGFLRRFQPGVIIEPVGKLRERYHQRIIHHSTCCTVCIYRMSTVCNTHNYAHMYGYAYGCYAHTVLCMYVYTYRVHTVRT